MEARTNISAFKRIVYTSTFYRRGLARHRPAHNLSIKIYDNCFDNKLVVFSFLSPTRRFAEPSLSSERGLHYNLCAQKAQNHKTTYMRDDERHRPLQ